MNNLAQNMKYQSATKFPSEISNSFLIVNIQNPLTPSVPLLFDILKMFCFVLKDTNSRAQSVHQQNLFPMQ